jgi:hypothetical protein
MKKATLLILPFIVLFLLSFGNYTSNDSKLKNLKPSSGKPKFDYNKLYAQWNEISMQWADTAIDINGNSSVEVKRRNDTILQDYISDTSDFISRPELYTLFILTKDLKWVDNSDDGVRGKGGTFIIDSTNSEIISETFPALFFYPVKKEKGKVHLKILYLDDDYLLLKYKYENSIGVFFLINHVTVDKWGLGDRSPER